MFNASAESVVIFKDIKVTKPHGRLVPRQLNTLLHLHLRPINLVVFKGPSASEEEGDLILEGASRLDAFSGYPFRT